MSTPTSQPLGDTAPPTCKRTCLVPGGWVTCDLPKGHNGDHLSGKYIAWPNEEDTPEDPAASLAALRSAVREWAEAEDAIHTHPGAFDSSPTWAEEMDALFTDRDEKAARLRSLVPSNKTP